MLHFIFHAHKRVGYNLQICISYQRTNFLISLTNSSFSCHSIPDSLPWTIINIFEVVQLIRWNFDTLQNRSEAIRCNSVITVIYFDMFLKLNKILLSKCDGILDYVDLKKSYFKLWKHEIIWNISLTHQTKQYFND